MVLHRSLHSTAHCCIHHKVLGDAEAGTQDWEHIHSALVAAAASLVAAAAVAEAAGPPVAA
jgi:hypothetical protein